MDIIQLGAFGELVGGFAVLVTLVYLAVQVRQTSTNVRAAPYQLALQGRTALRMAVCSEGKLLAAFTKGLGSLDTLDSEEAMRFHVFMVEELRMIQSAFFLYRDGVSNPEAWQHELAVIGTYRDSPGFRDWWATSRSYYSEEFVRVVESTPPVTSFGLEALASRH